MFWIILMILCIVFITISSAFYLDGSGELIPFVFLILTLPIMMLSIASNSVSHSIYSQKDLDRVLKETEILDKAKDKMDIGEYYKIYYEKVKKYNDMSDDIEKCRKRYNFWYTIG